jgi:hypothetical protein
VLLIVREIVPGMGADEYNAAGAPVTNIKQKFYPTFERKKRM